jgi:RNA 3'-terminal phosphate cyclase (ATP)
MSKIITIDGGAGGGQMLRTALSLSMATGRPFRMTRIRAGRPRPGLMRQHLTCVRAAVEISDGCADGDIPKSTELVFRPGEVLGGEWKFAIGTAGSVHLLMQTLLPAFLAAGVEAKLRLEGGTHNPMAPSAEFIQLVWLPMLARMGAEVAYTLVETGFAPAGGGVIEVGVPAVKTWQRLDLLERGEPGECKLMTRRRALAESISQRMLHEAGARLGWSDREDICLPDGPGQGIVCQAYARFGNSSELITTFGEQGVSAEKLADRAAKTMQDYLACGVPVGRSLADQLLLPMALAGGGSFLTMAPGNHFRTNIEVIRQFLDIPIEATEVARGRWLVNVGG